MFPLGSFNQISATHKRITMASKLNTKLLKYLIFTSFSLILLYSTFFTLHPPIQTIPSTSKHSISSQSHCDVFNGKWVFDPTRKPIYDSTCPFHRNAWNCLRNQRKNMGRINSWKWVPEKCDLFRVDPIGFMSLMRNKKIGFVGDSINENLLASFLCVLRVADLGAKKWKKKGAWRGAYYPNFNLTVGYHRAVLLAKYQWQPKQSRVNGKDESEGTYRVDVDIPADDWAGIADFYDVLVFNTGPWWRYDKFPKETPLVFYKAGKPILPPLGMLEGYKSVVENMAAYVQREFSRKALKFWQLQSPRHFYGGEWNQNGSCLFDDPLEESQLDSWFDPSMNGVNKEARQFNRLIRGALQGTDIQVLDFTHLSEFRADAHPAIWLGSKDAVAVWGQDCMHWCLPGVPDTWVDILSQLIRDSLETK